MKILGIETSCDETALSYISSMGDLSSPTFKVLGTALNSQIEIHKEYGGVYPALAKREHAKNLVPLLKTIFKDKDEVQADESDVQIFLEREPELKENLIDFVKTHKKPDLDIIAVTYGPGLEPALWIGINFAKALGKLWNIPVIKINHMEGHMVSSLLQSKIDSFPAVSLLISGGHTELIEIKKWGEYKLIGQTVDDAVGEAYDKVARMLELPYPGGPEISKLAEMGRVKNVSTDDFPLPRPMLNSKDLNFSFSGLKTAVLYLLKDIEDVNDDIKLMVAKEFEQAVVDVLLKKTKKAMEEVGTDTLIVGGGVIANQYIRDNLKELGTVHFPTKELSTDNATMIAMAGYIAKLNGASPDLDFKAVGNLKL